MSLGFVELERTGRVAPLGLLFRDAATKNPVTAGLNVDVYPPGRPGRRTRASVNRSGVYVLHHLEGLRDAESGAGDDAYWRDVVPRPFVVEVTDPRGHYQPVRFDVAAPHRGILAGPGSLAGSPVGTEGGVDLYPTIARPAPAGLAALYADLRDPIAGRPAAWAILDVTLPSGTVARGLAGADGRLAVVFPYPEPEAETATGEPVGSPIGPSVGSPVRPTTVPLAQQTWPLRLAARYRSPGPERAPAIPDLGDVLSQPPATLWQDLARTRPLAEVTLRFGEWPVLRTVDATGQTRPTELLITVA